MGVSATGVETICPHPALQPLVTENAQNCNVLTVIFSNRPQQPPEACPTDQGGGERMRTHSAHKRHKASDGNHQNAVTRHELASKNNNGPHSYVARHSRKPSQHQRLPGPVLFRTLNINQSSSTEVLVRRLIGTCA